MPEGEDLSLPPYKYFGSPVGMTVWNDGERVVLMKIGELWGANHDHLDTGCFQVYCGGALASDSGVYDSYNSPHRLNYAKRTSAHNCLTVYDPEKPNYGEWACGIPYDGGTRHPCAGKEAKTLELWKENYRMAKVLYHTESNEVCEIAGDLTEAYAHTCNKVIRKMRWEPLKGEYGILTVNDIVESKSENFIRAFHIHCQTEPERFDNGVIINYDKYKLVCRVISPVNARIEIIGGEGHEFEIDGINFDTEYKKDTEAGWGQIIITDINKTSITEFTVEMEIQRRKN